jgi:hypothetical protein
MLFNAIEYSSGYAFVLEKEYSLTVQVPLLPTRKVGTRFVSMDKTGLLVVAEGYAWDGASGPMRQSPDIIRPSLVHDALYQLMREDLIDRANRAAADKLLRDMCVEDGSPSWYADAIHLAVQAFGARFVQPGSTHLIMKAPVPVLYPSAGELEAP